jgi:hypothetical protein
MIIEKYGKVPHQNDYYGKRVVCRNCGSRLIIQEDDDVTYDGKEGPFCFANVTASLMVGTSLGKN